MTLLFMDGFDHYATADITKKWTTNSSATISTSGGRRSSGALSCAIGNYAVKTLSTTYSTIIVGFALKPNSLSDSWRDILSLFEGATQHLTFTIKAAGKILIYRGNSTTGTLLATGTVTINTGVWTYVEVKVTINDTTGSTEVRLNGVADSGLTLTNTDTRNGGTSGAIDGIWTGTSSSMSALYDDYYVCSTAGSTNNNFLGDCRVDTILPTGDGNYTQFTPSTGTAHWSLVDENPPNTTDYVSSATSGDRDSYTFPDLSGLSSQTVYGIQINAAALKSDAGARSLGTMSRLSGADKDGVGTAMSTSLVYISEIQETDPTSAAWTESNVNAAEFGVKVTA